MTSPYRRDEKEMQRETDLPGRPEGLAITAVSHAPARTTTSSTLPLPIHPDRQPSSSLPRPLDYGPRSALQRPRPLVRPLLQHSSNHSATRHPFKLPSYDSSPADLGQPSTFAIFTQEISEVQQGEPYCTSQSTTVPPPTDQGHIDVEELIRSVVKEEEADLKGQVRAGGEDERAARAILTSYSGTRRSFKVVPGTISGGIDLL
ncbi:hypothetical protein BJ170DRAFT_679725 [Xylariales sp. AK1849]|nr:hypothetical protein BJ170DRAFT_679725 [Xylariales sp. AK1849]